MEAMLKSEFIPAKRELLLPNTNLIRTSFVGIHKDPCVRRSILGNPRREDGWWTEASVLAP
jgi:hypothetical protein